MLYGNVPVKAYYLKDLANEEKYYKDYEYKKSVSSTAIDLLKRMLTKNPKLRLTAQEVLKHNWL